jgi:apolipoprotein N-acyltransferase
MRRAVAPLLGAASVLCFAPFGAWWLQPLLLAALLHELDVSSRPQGRDAAAAGRAAFRLGAAYGAGLFGIGIFWLWNSLYTIGQAPLPLAFLVLATLVAIMAAYHGLALWLTARLAPVAGAWRWFAVWPAAFVLAEWLRGWVLSGFPWFSLGYAQVDSPLARLAPLVGVHGISFAVLLAAAALRALWAWRGERDALLRLAGAVVAASAVIWLAGAKPWTTPSGAPLRIALVQANIAQDLKWDPEQVVPTLLRYRELTQPIEHADLVVWPEAALPILWHEIPPEYLDEVAGPGRPPLVMGILVHEHDSDRWYNSIVAITPPAAAASAPAAPPQFYRKRRLVPFAEFFPVPGWVREWLKLMSLPYSDFDRGPSGQAPLAVAGTQLGASVCFEDAFPDAMMDALPAAALLVNVSNDAWFGDSIGPHQHLQIARLRALEAGRPLLRATSTGITAAVDAQGRLLARLPQFEPGVLRASVQPMQGLTPFARLRDWPLLLLSLGLLAFAWVRSRKG